MEWVVVEGLATLKFDLIFTLALAGLLLLVGYGITSRVPLLSRSNVPAPVIAGLLFAIVVLIVRQYGGRGVALDSSLRQPLQILFFTVVGYGATASLLRAGGWRMALLLLLATLAAVVQNVVGISIARLLGAPDALGVICGALTLTGGPATGLAFTPQFEALGVPGAAALIIASATFGILVSSLIGNPVATLLIRRLRLAAPSEAAPPLASALQSRHTKSPPEEMLKERATESESHAERLVDGGVDRTEGLTSGALLRSLLVLLIVMGAGAIVGGWLNGVVIPIPFYGDFPLTLPAYINAMVIAAAVRNLNDRLHVIKLHTGAVEAIGVVALALFLVLALMDLKLWQLSGLALPALAILLIQICLTVLFALLAVFPLMGRDYEAAVTTSGYLGFGLGITPNAVANMETLAQRFRPAPRSFLVVPIVGAFFIDFTNSLVITFFINLLR